jgi:hypothetical protein
MTQSGNPRENAIAERVNGILKTEWIYDRKAVSWHETVAFVGKIIDLYNHQRPHQSIGYMVPAQVHQTGMKTQRMWKNYYRKRDVSKDGKAREDGHNRAHCNGETRSGYASASFPRCNTENQN